MQRTSKMALNSGFIPAEASALHDDVILLCLASSTRPRRRFILVGFDLNLITFGVIYNFSHPLPCQFHYCFPQRGVLYLGYLKWLTVRENNNLGKRAKIESQTGCFMDSKEN